MASMSRSIKRARDARAERRGSQKAARANPNVHAVPQTRQHLVLQTIRRPNGHIVYKNLTLTDAEYAKYLQEQAAAQVQATAVHEDGTPATTAEAMRQQAEHDAAQAEVS